MLGLLESLGLKNASLLSPTNVPESQELRIWYAVSGGGWVARAVQQICMGVSGFVEDGGGEIRTVWVDRDGEVQEREGCG